MVVTPTSKSTISSATRRPSISTTFGSMCSTYAVASATPQLLNLGPAHGALPPLRLQIDDVQAQAVLADHAIDPFIAALANGLAGVGAGAAVSHLQKQIHHEALEECRGEPP